ncbi:MAG: HNH endonuclease signature motif containing protein, partial [Calditrichia bacterium]
TTNVYNRSSIVRKNVLSRANNCCEYCGEIGFLTTDGMHYLETHHIIPLSEDGSDDELNVIALCPNHHRIAHYGKDKLSIQKSLTKKIIEIYGK